MNTRKLTAALLAAALVTGMAGCSSSQKEEESPAVSLTVKVPTLTMNCLGNPDIIDAGAFMQHAAEKFSETHEGISIKVEVFDYVDENEAITGCYGTEDAVDVLYEGYFNMAAYVSDGNVVPLDDIISDELRADINDASWAQSMKNGKTYMMPYLSMQNILIYNKQLLTDCGLEQFLSDGHTIQNWTAAEWETILDGLAAGLPEGSYPMMMYGVNNQGDTHIMSFIRAFGSPIFAEDGSFDFESAEALQALKWIQDGVGRGWYPPHPENLEVADSQQLFSNGQLGFYVFNNANFVLYEDDMENYGYVNFPGNVATSFITGFEVFDNGDSEKVKAAKEFVKFIYEDEELLELSAGTIPESRTVAEKYADEIEMLPEFTANMDNVVDFMNGSPNWQGEDNSVRSVFWPHIHELLALRTTPEECAEALNRDCNAAIQVEVRLHD